MSRCAVQNSDFQDAILEEFLAQGAVFLSTNFANADLSNCSFRQADLRGAGLAEIEWDGCDLNGADLRGCTFHLGSTRSGLVGSPYPSHGTRTGFYTDDYNDQHFKPPEAIRKASLTNCDLRGANILNVDFYLVDLRGTKIDAWQKAQLVATGAILDDDSR